MDRELDAEAVVLNRGLRGIPAALRWRSFGESSIGLLGDVDEGR